MGSFLSKIGLSSESQSTNQDPRRPQRNNKRAAAWPPSSHSPPKVASRCSGGVWSGGVRLLMSRPSELPVDAHTFGLVRETWRRPEEWKRFANHLDNMSEGEDSDGRDMSLGRYALFVELYARLYDAEQRRSTDLRSLVLELFEHDEDFFGMERCLRCIDAGMRKQIVNNVRQVRQNRARAGAWVFQPAYPRVLDKLNEQLGFYQQKKLNSNDDKRSGGHKRK